MKHSMCCSYIDPAQVPGPAGQNGSIQRGKRCVDSDDYDLVWYGEPSDVYYNRLTSNEGAQNDYLTILGTRGLSSQSRREGRGWREVEEEGRERGEEGRERRKISGMSVPLLDDRVTAQGFGRGSIHGNQSEAAAGGSQRYKRFSEGDALEEERDVDSHCSEGIGPGDRGREGVGKRKTRLAFWGRSIWSTAVFDRASRTSRVGKTSPICENDVATPNSPYLPPAPQLDQSHAVENTTRDPPTFVVHHQTPQGMGVGHQGPRGAGGGHQGPRGAGVSHHGPWEGKQGADPVLKDVKPRSRC